MNLKTHFLPSHVAADALRGVVVVIDQLRASSTIVAALASGATAVVPCLRPEDAVTARANRPTALLLGGERHGRLIDGFDLANSPREYRTQRVAGKCIAFTTTNGTKALLHARLAGHVLVGCLNNRAAVAHTAATLASQANAEIQLLCAGTGGAVCLDDVLAAGAIASSIQESMPTDCDDETRIAERAFRDAMTHGVLSAMRESQGGRNLIEIGMEADVADCSRLDITTVVPHFVAARNEVLIPRAQIQSRA